MDYLVIDAGYELGKNANVMFATKPISQKIF